MESEHTLGAEANLTEYGYTASTKMLKELIWRNIEQIDCKLPMLKTLIIHRTGDTEKQRPEFETYDLSLIWEILKHITILPYEVT